MAPFQHAIIDNWCWGRICTHACRRGSANLGLLPQLAMAPRPAAGPAAAISHRHHAPRQAWRALKPPTTSATYTAVGGAWSAMAAHPGPIITTRQLAGHYLRWRAGCPLGQRGRTQAAAGARQGRWWQGWRWRLPGGQAAAGWRCRRALPPASQARPGGGVVARGVRFARDGSSAAHRRCSGVRIVAFSGEWLPGGAALSRLRPVLQFRRPHVHAAPRMRPAPARP